MQESLSFTPEQLSVEAAGELIHVRISGVPCEALLRDCQQRVLELVGITGRRNVLYDTREMAPPEVKVTQAQRRMDELQSPGLRRAIVVPDTKLAYLARLAFGEGDYRVFYDDVEAARAWLSGEG
jgi:hypothetical protein